MTQPPQTPNSGPPRRPIASGLQITAVILGIILLFLIVQNIRLGQTYLWFFNLATARAPGVSVPIPGIAVATGWVVLGSALVGGIIGWVLARGIRSRR